MPTISVTLPDVTQSVFRPVVIDVANQLKEWTKIDKDVPIFFGNDIDQLQTAGAGLDNKDDRFMRSDSTRRLNVKATETYAEDQQITDVTGKSGNNRIFEDRSIDAWMAPSKVSSRVVLELEFRTRSKEEAHRWRDDINIRYLQGRRNLRHEVSYAYTLPIPAWEIIEQLNKKQEAIAGYGLDMLGYMQSCMSNRVTVISNETGSNKKYAVTETQANIQGYFGFTNESDKAEFEESTSMYIIRFSYNFVYQRPGSLDIHYPIIVHQQLLDRPFIEFVNAKREYDPRSLKRSQFLWGMEPFEKQTFMKFIKPTVPYIRIPMQDDFKLNYTFPGTGTFLLVLLQQTKAEKLAFNLRQLGEISLDSDILDWIAEGEYKHIGKPGKSIMQFDVYRNDQLVANPSVTIDEELNVHLNIDVDLRKEYRVRCAVFTDLSFVDRKAIDRLMAHPRAFSKVFNSINELLMYDSDFQKLGSQKKIYPWQLSKLYECIMGQGIGNIYSGPSSTYGFGAWGTNINSQARTFMTEIPEHILRTYRASRVTRKDQQIFGIIGFNREQENSFVKKGS